jgi:reactive intermediate/imine deaminase
LLIAALALSSALAAQEPGRAATPEKAHAHSNRFYSPAVDSGDYLYVSGQGPRRPDGSLPASFSEQVRQVLDNLQAAVKSAGLSLDHVVYVQVYLEDMTKYDELKKAISGYFGTSQPAQAVLGVARTPDSSIEISAVAVHSLEGKKPIYPSNYKIQRPRTSGDAHP